MYKIIAAVNIILSLAGHFKVSLCRSHLVQFVTVSRLLVRTEQSQHRLTNVSLCISITGFSLCR